ncbi:isotrichodermin C-15 hydroxylase [Zopfia rhizophila CBS 207.26]|uniref:Isotrichodermin C-15 hydroxylase n=1 Tax=Zopfia rhizophila CBS 207.26 TaxID=1314779 RepID=A0A6A6DV55_9PEZI|nr:isotrichodermin C-15 hydroxylase [Zopfia rhizophila CBS 207.26]
MSVQEVLMPSLTALPLWALAGLTLFTILITYVFLNAIYNIWFHPLRKYPGPWWQAANRLPYMISIFQGTATRNTAKWHEKYGHVVRITPDTLSFTSSQAWTDIYGLKQSQQRGNLPKDPKYYIKTPEGADTISTANDADHRRLRRIQAHAFSEKALSLQEDYLRQYTSLFISRLREQTDKPGGGAINIARWLNFLTTDIIGELTFAESFGGLEKGQLHPWLESIFWTLKAFTFIRELNRWPSLVKRALFACIPKGMIKHQQASMAFGAEAAKRRMEMQTDRNDFMSYILKQEGEKRMTESEIEAAAITFIVAGSETTATMLSGTMYLLCTNPAMLRKLTSMVRTDFPSESDLTLVKLQQHKYLNAVLQEGLRLYPPAPDNLFRVTPDTGSIVMGEMVPPHTSMTMNLWAAHRSPDNFHRPTEFIPERWMKAAPVEFQRDDRNGLLGEKANAGGSLAWAEMRMILAYMLWHFDFELEPDSQGWIERQKIFMLWEKVDLNVRVSHRRR